MLPTNCSHRKGAAQYDFMLGVSTMRSRLPDMHTLLGNKLAVDLLLDDQKLLHEYHHLVSPPLLYCLQTKAATTTDYTATPTECHVGDLSTNSAQIAATDMPAHSH